MQPTGVICATATRAPQSAPQSNRNKQTTSNRDNGAQHGARLVLTKPASTQHGALVATAQKRGGLFNSTSLTSLFLFILFINNLKIYSYDYQEFKQRTRG